MEVTSRGAHAATAWARGGCLERLNAFCHLPGRDDAFFPRPAGPPVLQPRVGTGLVRPVPSSLGPRQTPPPATRAPTMRAWASMQPLEMSRPPHSAITFGKNDLALGSPPQVRHALPRVAGPWLSCPAGLGASAARTSTAYAVAAPATAAARRFQRGWNPHTQDSRTPKEPCLRTCAPRLSREPPPLSDNDLPRISLPFRLLLRSQSWSVLSLVLGCHPLPYPQHPSLGGLMTPAPPPPMTSLLSSPHQGPSGQGPGPLPALFLLPDL